MVCEEGDLTSAGSQPPSRLKAFADLFGRLGPARGLDHTLGRELFQMVLAAEFPAPEITFNRPVVARGEHKRFLELSGAEAGTAFVTAALVTRQELAGWRVEMQRVADDETVLALMPGMSQVWARKRVRSADDTRSREASTPVMALVAHAPRPRRSSP